MKKKKTVKVQVIIKVSFGLWEMEERNLVISVPIVKRRWQLLVCVENVLSVLHNGLPVPAVADFIIIQNLHRLKLGNHQRKKALQQYFMAS